MQNGNVACLSVILGGTALLIAVVAKPELLIPFGLIAFAAWVVRKRG